jgi:hypothetical protein
VGSRLSEAWAHVLVGRCLNRYSDNATFFLLHFSAFLKRFSTEGLSLTDCLFVCDGFVDADLVVVVGSAVDIETFFLVRGISHRGNLVFFGYYSLGTATSIMKDLWNGWPEYADI